MGTKVQCLRCKEIIESKHRHDFVWCGCGAIFVDGGDDYLRYGGEIHYIKILHEEKEKDEEV